MAKQPQPPAEGYGSQAWKELETEAKDRLYECRRQKQEWDLDIREGYFFAAPHRMRDIRSQTAPSETKRHDEAEQQTGIASELARDFVTEVVNAFMPEAEPWAEQRPGPDIPAAIATKAADEIKAQDSKIFAAIKASSLYTVMPMAFAPDLAIGTAALWIDDPYPSRGIVCQAVPLRELEVNVGPHGQIDDRFVVRHTKNRFIPALLKGIRLPEECTKDIREKPFERTEVRWGFWRLWDRIEDEVWKHVVMVKDKVVHSVEIVGEGSCPLIPMRFNPAPEWAYGSGPLIEALPDLRLLDSLEGDKVDHIELRLRPPTSYPDDSMGAIENGIEPGSAYPIRVGAEDAIKPIFEGGDMQPALFETEALETRLKRRFFLDFPEQRGKTPPTLGQWLDEMARAQRRIGTPGMPFWREGPAQIFLRYKYLLTKRGTIEPIKVDEKFVALTPFNPAQRAAEQQEVLMAARFMEIVAGSFPEEFRVWIDGKQTMANIREKMRANLVAMRKEEDVKQALAQIQPLIEGRQRIDPAGGAAAAGLG